MFTMQLEEWINTWCWQLSPSVPLLFLLPQPYFTLLQNNLGQTEKALYTFGMAGQACLFETVLSDYSYPWSAERDQALWLKAGTNVRKWFRLLRFSRFFPLCGVTHGKKNKKTLQAIGRETLASVSTWNKMGVWFPVSTETRSKLDKPLRFERLFMLVFLEPGSFNTLVTAPGFHKGFRHTVSSQCFSLVSLKSAGCVTVTSMWLVPLRLALSPTHTYILFNLCLSGCLSPTLSAVLVNNPPKLPLHVSPSTRPKFPLNLEQLFYTPKLVFVRAHIIARLVGKSRTLASLWPLSAYLKV